MPDKMGMPDTFPASGEAQGSSGSCLPRQRHWHLLSAAPRLASRPQALWLRAASAPRPAHLSCCEGLAVA